MAEAIPARAGQSPEDMVPFLRASGMVHQPSSSGQAANDQKTLCLPAEEVPLPRPGGMVPFLRPNSMVHQSSSSGQEANGSISQAKWHGMSDNTDTSQADLRPTMAEAIPARAGQSP